MSRTHPPTLLTLATRTILEEGLFARGDRVLVAVSGGPDSMALLDVLAHLQGKVKHELVAHGVDHGLRPEAKTELDLAERHAKALGVPFARSLLTVPRGGNLQARAREARYEALRTAARAQGAGLLATAHHADDRAETVLLRLLRGAGPTGLAVLPPRDDDLIRPFVRARRADIEAHIARHGIPFANDPSNADPRYARTRVRRELIPLLQQLSPNIVGHLCALADQLRAQSMLGSRPDAPHMYALPRATREALATLARERSKKARVSLPGGLIATYDRKKGPYRNRGPNGGQPRGG
jgi:tRNA(Ile)-lysidine synthase